jgi:NADH dehydrogenase
MILSAGGPAARALYARASGRALWLGDGSSLEQPLDARDFVLALTTAATRSEPLAGVFDIAGPECLTQRDLVLRSASLLGTKPRPIHVPLGIARLLARAAERFTENPPITEAMLDVLLHHDRVDIAPASRALDLAPRPLDETLRHVLRAHASQL